MILSHEHKYVFVEIPHTGSHSIAAELIAYYGGERILRKHANLTQFRSQASASEKKYFVFGTVRNPLDSAVTDYSKLQSNHRDQYTNEDLLIARGGHITPRHLEEFDFVHNQGADFPAFMQRFRRKIYHNWFLIGSARYDFVLRFENLRADYAEVIGRLGLDLVRELPHVNPTKKKARDYAEFYTADIRDFVARYYGPFMQHWGYDFPAAWGEVTVPWSSRLRFAMLEASVNAVAKFAKLDPDNPVLSRLKKVSEAF